MRLLSLNASTPTIKQGEFNSSAVEILVPLDMRGYNLFVVFELPSGEKVFTPSILLDANNMITYALPAAVLSEIGRVQVELQGFIETSYIKSVTYSFTVVKSLTGPTNGTGPELKQVDYLPWFTDAAGFKSEVELIANAYKVAEALRVSKEIARVAGESARVIAENNRITGEDTRVANEAIRVPSESGRVTAESGRVTAESGRVTAESGRVTAESGRITAESGRVTSESGRVTAESGRVTAESGRAATLASKADKTTTINTKPLSANVTINAIDVPNTPAGGVAAANVQAAINELNAAKASRAQEGWITPTLLSAYTSTNLRFYKDTIGIVHFRGSVRNGTAGQLVMALPLGYRPNISYIYSAINTDAKFSLISLGVNGDIVLYSYLPANIDTSLESISFRTEA